MVVAALAVVMATAVVSAVVARMWGIVLRGQEQSGLQGQPAP